MVKVNSRTSKPWISPDLLEMIRHKTDLYHEYKSSLSQEAWNNYTTYKNRLTSELRKAEREFYHTISDKCKSPDASKLLWSVLNRLNGKESRGIPTLSNNGLLVDKEEEKAELLNEIFVNITKDCNHPDRTMKLPILTSKQFTTLQVTREEVLTVLLSLQVDKAPGPDGISNKLLREAAPEICDSLQCLFNYSLSTGTFPTEWKQSNVTPVYKKGDKTDPLNYRPISLLPTVAKVMERLVHNHLYSYLEENNLLHNNQSGFRKGDGTVLQLIRMVNDWARSIDDPDISCTAVVFLDVRRAFDTVWHQGLTYKLTRYGVGGPLLHWFDSYLTGRQQRVVINGVTSSWGKTAAGVPQGSILGPLLFLVYLNDLMSLPCRSALNCFADDTSLYNSAKTSQEVAISINADLQLVSTWFSDWGLTLHPDKCKVVCVKSGRKNALLPPIYLHGKLVEQVSSYSHLGVTIHQTLTWTEHVQVTTSKSRKVLGVLRKVMGKLGRQALETAYFALVRPKLEYAAALLGDLNNTASKMLEQVQYHACCLITGAMKGTPYSNLLQELEWDTLSSRRQYNSLTIMYRMTKGLVPPHLQSLTPPTRGSQFTRIQLRNNTHLCVPRCRTQVYKTSFIPHTSSLWNQLPQTVSDASNLAAFKRASKKHLLTTRHHQMYRTLGSRPNNIRTTRLRVGWCQLNSTLYKMKIKGKACVCADLLQLLNDLSNNVPPFPSYFKQLEAARSLHPTNINVQLRSEVETICSSHSPLSIRVRTIEDIRSISTQQTTDYQEQNAPTLYNIIANLTSPQYDRETERSASISTVLLSTIENHGSRRSNGLQTIIGLMLVAKTPNDQVIQLLNHAGMSVHPMSVWGVIKEYAGKRRSCCLTWCGYTTMTTL
ncbi:hypothetical protein Bbelb_049230 [Branchiostoma belcheri]|nr:hypothetical protein Bbelb_049230 [Branchiostoma belcheri]